MPCIVDTPEEQLSELARENRLLTGALCAALTALHKQYHDPVTCPFQVTYLYQAYRLVDLTDSGVDEYWLKSWWSQHIMRDNQRRAQEAAATQATAVKETALSKLTSEEREALGHPRSLVDAKHMDAAATPSFSGGRRNRGMPGGDI